MMRGDDQTSRILDELCALVLALLRLPHLTIPASWGGARHPDLPPPFPPPSRRPRAVAARRPPPLPQASPAAVASLMLGVSMALMLCGSVTFVIGFMLMPWVLGMLMVFYLVGIVSSLSGLGRAILCPSATAPSTPRVSPKDVQGQFLSKFSTD